MDYSCSSSSKASATRSSASSRPTPSRRGCRSFSSPSSSGLDGLPGLPAQPDPRALQQSSPMKLLGSTLLTLLSAALIAAAAVYAGSGAGGEWPPPAAAGSAAVIPLERGQAQHRAQRDGRGHWLPGVRRQRGLRRLDARGPGGRVLTFAARGTLVRDDRHQLARDRLGASERRRRAPGRWRLPREKRASGLPGCRA